MDLFRSHPRIFAAVSLVYWPFVWLQIWRLRNFANETGRAVCFCVTAKGQIKIRFLADAPAPTSRYRYTAPAAPAWQRPALATDFPQYLLSPSTPPPADDDRLAPTPANTADTRNLIPP